MEWRIVGVVMVIPTLAVAIVITIMNFKRKEDESWINLATCFWITANSYWMCCEFFKYEQLKYFAFIPFAFGFVCVGWFYLKRLQAKRSSKLEDYL